MMKFKSQILCSVLAVLATACSDGTFNPTVGAGYNTGLFNNGLNNGLNGFNNGFNNGGFFNGGFNTNGMPCNWNQTNMGACNPYSSMSYSSYYNPYLMYYNQMYQPGAQAALAWRAQLMFNPGFRINSGLYYPDSPYSNVYVAQYPSYTPTSCACAMAPCDCESILSQLHHSGRYSRRIERMNNRIERRNGRILRRIGRLSGRLSPTYHADGCYPSSLSNCSKVVVQEVVVPDPSTGSRAQNQNSNTDQKFFAMEIRGEDAKQLYIRLAMSPESIGDGATKLTGKHYWCSKDKKENYICQLDFDLDSGTLKEQYSRESNAGEPALSNPNAANGYQGLEVTIKRETPGLAILTLPSRLIQNAFDKLNDADGKDKNTDDLIVDLDLFRIIKTETSSGPTYAIEVRVNTATGKAEAALGGAGAQTSAGAGGGT
jgi:hypothetical protein